MSKKKIKQKKKIGSGLDDPKKHRKLQGISDSFLDSVQGSRSKPEKRGRFHLFASTYIGTRTVMRILVTGVGTCREDLNGKMQNGEEAGCWL